MNITSGDTSQISARWQRFAILAWHTLRSPKLTGALLLILAGVVLLGLVIPQQSSPSSDVANWISSLPPLVQLWGELLFFLRFARIFQSLWFWLPVALLLLNSLIALADYGPGSWQRLKKTVPPIDWQHPLATRGEHIIRLPKSPDTLLTALQTNLTDHSFELLQSGQSEERVVGAARRPWAWLGVIAAYSGLVLLATGFLVSYYFLRTEYLTLFPDEVESSRLLAGTVEFARVGSETEETMLIVSPGDSRRPKLAFPDRLFQPFWLNYTLIWPVAREPILTVEARDASASLLTLIPVQEDLPPAERLHLPLTESGAPLYFVIPSTGLAVQILPDPGSAQPRYNVQVRRGSDEVSAESFTVNAGESFEVDTLLVTISLDHNLKLVTFFDPALPLYLLSLILVGGGALLTMVCALSPAQLWLVLEVKGLGGQLYGVLEQYGSAADIDKFLKQLLTPERESTGGDSEPVADME